MRKIIFIGFLLVSFVFLLWQSVGFISKKEVFETFLITNGNAFFNKENLLEEKEFENCKNANVSNDLLASAYFEGFLKEDKSKVLNLVSYAKNSQEEIVLQSIFCLVLAKEKSPLEKGTKKAVFNMLNSLKDNLEKNAVLEKMFFYACQAKDWDYCLEILQKSIRDFEWFVRFSYVYSNLKNTDENSKENPVLKDLIENDKSIKAYDFFVNNEKRNFFRFRVDFISKLVDFNYYVKTNPTSNALLEYSKSLKGEKTDFESVLKEVLLNQRSTNDVLDKKAISGFFYLGGKKEEAFFLVNENSSIREKNRTILLLLELSIYLQDEEFYEFLKEKLSPSSKAKMNLYMDL